MQVTVNNHTHTIAESSTLLDLLVQLELQGKRIAVEMNGDIIPKGEHAHTVLHDGAQLEIVVAVGGG